MSATPYLSVVATARNDDHGGRLLYRMQLFLDGLIEQCNRYRLEAELILVEWNPPEDRPRLSEALRWPEDPGFLTIRIIEVPNSLHSRLRHSERLPLFQMIAKNVGIRRARGEYVLATNIDLLFSNELVEFIAKKGLKPGILYRVDRYDVEADIPEHVPNDERLQQCEQKLIRVSRRDGTLDLRDDTFYRIYDSLYYLPWWLGIPLRLVRDGWRPLLRGLAHTPVRLAVLPARAGRRVSRLAKKLWTVARRPRRRVSVSRRGRFGRLVDRLTLSHITPVRLAAVATLVAVQLTRFTTRSLLQSVAARGRAYRATWKAYARLIEFERARVKLHTNASGDFELLARADWVRTHGYAELELYSMHLDSLHMYMAYWSGVRESFLPYRIYHLEHEGGFKPDPEGSARLNDRLERNQVRQISNEQLFDWILEMARTRSPLQFTQNDWGYAAMTFPEVVISSSHQTALTAARA